MTWTCTYCGQPNLMEMTHCHKCGRPRKGSKRKVRFLTKERGARKVQ